jgi:hypothetical protein
MLRWLNCPQREVLPCFKTGILMKGNLKPAIVIRTEMRLVIAETKTLECPVIFLGSDPNGNEILIFQRIDIHNFGGNWSHWHCFPRTLYLSVQQPFFWVLVAQWRCNSFARFYRLGAYRCERVTVAFAYGYRPK